MLMAHDRRTGTKRRSETAGGQKMASLHDELRQLRLNNPDVAQILDTYTAVEQVYERSMEAMGILPRPSAPSVKNSAEVTISFQPASTERS